MLKSSSLEEADRTGDLAVVGTREADSLSDGWVDRWMAGWWASKSEE